MHSGRSPDGKGTLEDLAAQARRRGLQGFAITDHNVFHSAAAIRRAQGRDLLVLPGMEVSTLAGHCLAVGLKKAVKSGRGLAETLDAIRDAGGVGVPSHPYRRIHGVGESALREVRRRLVALEVYNARDGSSSKNARADRFARNARLGGTGGSDTHGVFELGNGYTLFPDFPDSVDAALAQLVKKRTWGAGRATPWTVIARQQVRTFRLWAERGFRPL